MATLRATAEVGTLVKTIPALLLLAAVSFLATLLVPYEYPSGDATEYVEILQGWEPVRINPNRLLLETTVFGAYDAFQRVTGVASTDPLIALLWMSRIVFLASVLAVFAIARQLDFGGVGAFAAAVGYASSHTILYFATDGEPILLAHLPLWIGGALHLRAARRSSSPLHFAAGFAYGLSVLTYVSNVLPVAVIGIVSVIAARRSWRFWIAPVSAVAVVVAGVAFAHSMSASELAIHRWVASYGGGSAVMSFGGNVALSAFRVIYGLGASLIASQGAARWVRHWTEGAESIEPRPSDALDLVAWGAALIFAGLATVLVLRRWSSLRGIQRAALGVCAGSVLAFLAFNYLWIGSDPQFWVPVVPFLWIAWGFGFAPSAQWRAGVIVVAVAVMIPYNVLCDLRPARGDATPKLHRIELQGRVERGSLVITPGLDWLATMCRYLPMEGRPVLVLWSVSTDPRYAGDLPQYLDDLDARIEATFAAGHPVYVRGVIEEPFPDGIPWREMEPRGFPLAAIQDRFARYEVGQAFTIGGDVFWKLSPPEPEPPPAFPLPK